MPLTEEPIGGNGRGKKIIWAYCAAAAVFIGAWVFIFVPEARETASRVVSVFSKTASDALSPREFGNLAAEIDLQAENLAVQDKNAASVAEFTSSASVPAETAVVDAQKSEKQKKNSSNQDEEKNVSVQNSASFQKSAEISFVAASNSSSNASIAQNSFSAEECVFSAAGTPNHFALISEIAWMGTTSRDGESGTAAASNEWIELKNNFGREINVAGWRLTDASGKFRITFEAGEKLPLEKFFLLERGDEDSLRDISADKIFAGPLSNTGMHLKLFARDCALVDEIDASDGWPGGDSDTKKTLERNWHTLGWYTSGISGGTPGQENSPPPPSYTVNVSIQGGGKGIIRSQPGGIACGAECAKTFTLGTVLTLTAEANSDSEFNGWVGMCSGRGTCKISSLSHNLFAAAVFLPKVEDLPEPQFPAVSTSAIVVSGGATTTAGDTGVPSYNLLIAAVQIAGGSASEDYIKIYNPADVPRDISGWKLRKRTSSGSESSIRVFPSGSSIPARGYFIWANSANGFSDTLGANTASTQTIAANNSIALLDPENAIKDAVAWGSGHASPYMEGTAFPINPGAGEVLSRTLISGEARDTDDNAADFEIR